MIFMMTIGLAGEHKVSRASTQKTTLENLDVVTYGLKESMSLKNPQRSLSGGSYTWNNLDFSLMLICWLLFNDFMVLFFRQG
jgi:hypothetical protein